MSGGIPRGSGVRRSVDRLVRRHGLLQCRLGTCRLTRWSTTPSGTLTPTRPAGRPRDRASLLPRQAHHSVRHEPGPSARVARLFIVGRGRLARPRWGLAPGPVSGLTPCPARGRRHGLVSPSCSSGPPAAAEPRRPGRLAGSQAVGDRNRWLDGRRLPDRGRAPPRPCRDVRGRGDAGWRRPGADAANTRDSDGTVWFGDPGSPGGRTTLRACAGLGKPVYVAIDGLTEPWEVAGFLCRSRPRRSGSSTSPGTASTEPGIGERVERFLVAVFARLAERDRK